MPPKFIDRPVQKSELIDLAKERHGDLVKAVVDVERKVMMVGAELHSDEEADLLEKGSQQLHLWGINIYPHKEGEELIEFDSVINLRPYHGNRSRGVDNPMIRQKIKEIISQLVKP